MNKFILIGLGNPGKEYEFTRHNAGKMFVRYLAEHPIEGIEAIETECYMNESGGWLRQRYPLSANRYPLFIIAHDDLDLPLGLFKIQFGRGPRQHKGILSIEAALGTTEFWRVRIGIGGSQFQHLKSQISNRKSFGENYVLSEFSKDELRRLHDVFTSARATLVLLFESNSPFPKIVEQ